MRRLLSCLLAAFTLLPLVAAGEEPAPSPARPEPEVLITDGHDHGGWGAPVVAVSRVRGCDAVFVGGRGGWLIDHRLTLGGGGFGLASGVPAPDVLQPTAGRYDLNVGYGGLWIEYGLAPLRVVHVSVGTLVGAGGVSLRQGGSAVQGDRSSAAFALEPSVLVELNLVRFARVAVGASYRWLAGVRLAGLTTGDVSGLAFVASVKLGKF
jgi:hypothetical protein